MTWQTFDFHKTMTSGRPMSTYKRRYDPYDDDEEDLDYKQMFRKFANSSTVHGTYFWGESRSIVGKIVWIGIVILGKSYSMKWF